MGGLANPDGSQVFCITRKSIVRCEMSAEPRTTVLGRSPSSNAFAVVRSPDNPNSMIAFHSEGLFRISLMDGSYVKFNAHWTWTGFSRTVRSVVVNPFDPYSAYVFHTKGLDKMDLQYGVSRKLGSQFWGMVTAAVWDQESESVFVFHHFGTYRVNVLDGSYEQVSSSKCWGHVRGAVNCPDGRALVVDRDGLFLVDMGTGMFTKVDDASWSSHSTGALCPLGPMAFASSACAPSKLIEEMD